MKNKFRITTVSALLFALSGFNSAQALTPAEILERIQMAAEQFSQALLDIDVVLDNHESRISDLEDANPNLGGYSMSFSGDGAPKNAVVSSWVDENGWTTYWVRSRYATSVEQISINGVLTQRPFIANYTYVQVDDVGNLDYVSNFIEAPDTANYVVYNTEESQYDPGSLAKTVIDDTLKEDWNVCTYGQTTICLPEVSLSATGEHVRTYNWSSIRGVTDRPNGATHVRLNGATFRV